MDGMGMLLKAAGFDPEQFQQFVSGMQATLQKFNDDLEAIKSAQAKLQASIDEVNFARVQNGGTKSE